MRRRAVRANRNYVPNTFIGGIAKLGRAGYNAPILTAAQLANTLGISESIIKGFKVVGEDVQCVLGEGVSIKSVAFRSNENLTYIDSNMIVAIGSSSFLQCSNLNSVNLPFVTIITLAAFKQCSSLYSVDFPLVTSINDSAFDLCSNLYSANFPLATMVDSNAFYLCSNLYSVNLPLATIINGNAFHMCSSLYSINLPSADRLRNGVFYGCTSLNLIDIKRCKFLSNTTSSNIVFENISLNAVINTNILLATVNDGEPDGDLLYAYTSRNATINFYDDDGIFVETYNP